MTLQVDGELLLLMTWCLLKRPTCGSALAPLQCSATKICSEYVEQEFVRQENPMRPCSRLRRRIAVGRWWSAALPVREVGDQGSAGQFFEVPVTRVEIDNMIRHLRSVGSFSAAWRRYSTFVRII